MISDFEDKVIEHKDQKDSEHVVEDQKNDRIKKKTTDDSNDMSSDEKTNSRNYF